MFAQSRTAVMVLYLLAGGFVLLVGRLAFVYYRTSDGALARDSRQVADSNPAARPPRSTDRLSPSAQLRVRDRMQELQQALERTNGLLAKKTTLLNQKVAECRALQKELDASIAFVFSVLGQGSDAEASGAESIAQLKDDLEAELLAFKSSLASSEVLQQEQGEQLAELQAELQRADLELAEIQMAANQEISLLEKERRELETMARETIVQFGPAAAPILTALLADQRPHVRAWAASALGDLGMDAQDAVPFLVELLTDADASVSASARNSLARIEP